MVKRSQILVTAFRPSLRLSHRSCWGLAGRATHLGLGAILAFSVGCGGDSEDDGGGDSADAVTLEQAPIATNLKELRAGLPYTPGIDESPLGGGAATCLANAKILVRAGNVSTSAAVVHSRSSLNVELGLDVSGTIPVSGITGAAGLAAKTTFDSRTATILFQSVGTYESSLGNETTPSNFDPANLAKCGFGYVTKAQHRVAAALVVTMHSTTTNVDLKVTGSASKPSVAEVKASLATVINRGNVEVSLHFANDTIPNLAAPPLAESALVVDDSDAGKQATITQINTALTWLANANSTINTYLTTLQTADPAANPPTAPAAPAVNVNFRYYPATPPEVRAAVESATKNVVAARQRVADVGGMIASWETYKKAATAGTGFMWNIAAEPAPTVDALNAKAADFLDTSGGKLRTYQDSVSDQIDGCAHALRDDPPAADAAAVVAGLGKACAAAAALPADRAKLLVQPIATGTVSETAGGLSCDTGYRHPMQKELPIFGAWSVDANSKSEGLWVQDNTCGALSGSSWMLNGKMACSPFLGHTGVSICVPTSTGPLPADGT